MKIVAAAVAAALLSGGPASIPHQVTHTRCAKLVAQDDYDHFEWVTRDDGRRDDVLVDTCHAVRFWRAAVVEWRPDEEVVAGDPP